MSCKVDTESLKKSHTDILDSDRIIRDFWWHYFASVISVQKLFLLLRTYYEDLFIAGAIKHFIWAAKGVTGPIWK